MGSRILDQQRQGRELGRLRSGYTDTSGAKARPVRSATWIITSHDKSYVDAAASLWGGTPEKWQPLGAGAAQWRVITEADTIDALLPPGDPLSQANEMWSRGGIARRCDGITDQLTDSPCLCVAQFGGDFFTQPKDKRCAATTRLSLILPAMPDIGVWRVETHGHYAANEIAATVDVILGATGGKSLVPVQIRIEPRTRVSEGKTKQFPVIVLGLRGITAGQILAGQTPGFDAQIGREANGQIGRPEQSALPSGPDPVQVEAQSIADKALDATNTDQIRDLWRSTSSDAVLASEVVLSDTLGGKRIILKDMLKILADKFTMAEQSKMEPGRSGGLRSVEDTALPAEPEDTTQIWIQAMAASPWPDTDSLIADFCELHGGQQPADVSAEVLTAYVENLKARGTNALPGVGF